MDAPTDPGQERFARLAAWTLVVASVLTTALFWGVGAHERVLATVPFGLVGLLGLAMIHLGYLTPALPSLMVGVWVATANGMLWGQGVMGPSVGGTFVLVTLLAAWVSGPRLCIALAVATPVVLFATAFATSLGTDLPRNVPVSPIVAAAILSGLVFVAAMLGLTTMRSFEARVRGQRSSEARFEAMFRAGPTPAAISRGDGQGILDCNEAFCRLIGRERKDVLGRTGRELGYWAEPRDLERCRGLLERDGAVHDFRTVFVRSGGEKRRVVLDTQRIGLEDGREGILWQAVDATNEHAARSALEDLNADLERRVDARTTELRTAIEELDSFSYSVAHDLNAPLRAINGRASLVMEGAGAQLGAEERSQLDRIRESTSRMAELIEDLLELSRVMRARLDVQDVDLSALAHRIAAELGAAEPGRKGRWLIEPGLSARADPGLMRSLLTNLLGNAWKYTRGRDEAVIELRAEARGDGLNAFTIRDNGIGFDPGAAGNLFKPFVRLHDDARFEGTGIGLATVARIVTRHGGSVAARGEPDAGAVVEFRLPG